MRCRAIHYGWVVITTSCIVVFGCLGLARFGYGMVLPAMKAGLGMSNTEAGMLASGDLTAYLAMSLAGGVLAARIGPRKVVTAGLLCTGVGMVITGVAPSLSLVAVGRVLTGLGSGASNVPVMGMLAAWTAPRRRGLAAGIAVAGSSLALIVLGPTVPRLLAAFGANGWRVFWCASGAVVLVIAALAGLLLRDRPANLGLHPLGTDPAREGAAPSTGKGCWRDVYTSPRVWHLGAVYSAFGFSYIIYMTFFTARLVGEAGYTTAAAGRLFMLMGWCSLLCGVLWGNVSDRFGRRWALAGIYALHAVAFSLFAGVCGRTGLPVSAALFGFSAWSVPAVMAATCGDVTGPRLAPAALGFITMFFGIGQVAGPSVAGALADASGSLSPALLAAATVAAMGGVGSLFLRESR